MNFVYNTFLTSSPTIEFLILRSLPAAHHEEVCDIITSSVGSYRFQYITSQQINQPCRYYFLAIFSLKYPIYIFQSTSLFKIFIGIPVIAHFSSSKDFSIRLSHAIIVSFAIETPLPIVVLLPIQT